MAAASLDQQATDYKVQSMSVPLVRNPNVTDVQSLGFFMSVPVAVGKIRHFGLGGCRLHTIRLIISTVY
jgi:hypothetical protein